MNESDRVPMNAKVCSHRPGECDEQQNKTNKPEDENIPQPGAAESYASKDKTDKEKCDSKPHEHEREIDEDEDSEEDESKKTG